MTRFRPRQERVVVLVYMIGLYMSGVDGTIVNTALPTITRDFHTTLASTQWMVLGYLLSLAAVIPSSGWLGDRFGTRRVYLTALCLFTGTSALCGLAQSAGQLTVFRIVQGIGGGMLTPVGQTMLFRTFSADRRAKAAGMVALGSSLAPAVGPLLGGVLVTELSWRWCFYVNLPFGIVALTIGLLFLHEHREPSPGGLDLPGFVLSGLGLSLLLYSISESPTRGWSNPIVISTGAVGIATVTALVFVELHRTKPMLNFRLLKNRIFRSTINVTLFSSTAYSGYLFVMPQFLQNARGASALSSGLTTFPGAVGLWINSQLSARVYPFVGPKRLILSGLTGVTIVFCSYSLLTSSTSTWLIRCLVFCSGSCIAWCNIPTQAAGFSTISSADQGRGSALFNTQRRMSGGLGVAVLATVISSSVKVGPTTTTAELVTAYHHAFLSAAALIVTAALFAVRIRDSDAAPSMRQRAGSRPADQPADAAAVSAVSANGEVRPGNAVDATPPRAADAGHEELTTPGTTEPTPARANGSADRNVTGGPRDAAVTGRTGRPRSHRRGRPAREE